MKLIRDLHNLNALHRPAVVSIGNYDGVHLGHCRLIHALKKKAKALGAQMTVLTFEPHPHEFFSPKNAPPRLMNWREKMDALCQQGVDQAMTLRFNDRLSQTSAEDFVENLLVGGLGAQHIVIGDDFRFGRKRLGDVALLTRLGRRFGFTVDTIDTCIVEGERVSSTRIREALRVGDFPLAERLLGHPFTMSGRISHGDKRGRTIGFPTANIVLRYENLPVWGVYAVRLRVSDGRVFGGVANVGSRPTVGGQKILLETHLFDFHETIYGSRVSVEFIEKIRDEQKFDSFERLREQIDRDAQAARVCLGVERISDTASATRSARETKV